MRTLRIYFRKLYIYIYHTAILTIIVSSIYLSYNWKIIPLEHFVIIVLEFYFCNMLSHGVHDQNRPIKFIMALKKNILREKERQGRGRGEDRIPSRLLAVGGESKVGLNPTNWEIMT